MSSSERKRPQVTDPDSERVVKKRKTPNKGKGKAKQTAPEWPEYFNNALNAVLAFVTSRRHLALSFPVIRSSVEKILKQPLELAKVAELKALLPDVIKFAYIPQNELLVQQSSSASREQYPDFSLEANVDSSEHVLILDFADSWKGGVAEASSGSLHLPPTRSTASTKRLIDKRDKRFIQAVNELLLASGTSSDPVSLLQAAAHGNVPVDPNHIEESEAFFPIPDPDNRPSIEAVLADIQEQPWYKGQICTHKTFSAKSGETELTLDHELSSSISKALNDSRKITSLYSHQVTAINAIGRGKDVIVSTSTASGKSVIYQVPLLRYLEADHDATAIFVYPTKALAQDQKAALERLIQACPGLTDIKVATYDGDTPQQARKAIRESVSVILTNFDMIHASILPQEDSWRPFLKRLKVFVVDELHYYSGLFGSHVAYILRRFRRICAAIGNRRIRFVSCSATISNPLAHMERVFGIDGTNIEVVTQDGAPRGEKNFVIWQPSSTDPEAPNLGRESPVTEAVTLMVHLMKHGVRVILFCKFRKACELVMKTMRVNLASKGRLDILERVKPYRGGKCLDDRREIEREAFSGKLLGIIATNALELGVDIGALDAVLMLGFPVNVASLRQQSGRAGRRSRDALTVLVAEALPIDQYYAQHPDEVFDKEPDDLVIDLESKITLEAHLQCAANEMPISLKDEVYFGPHLEEICRTRLTVDDDGWYHTYTKFLPYPSKFIAIRGVQEETYVILDATAANHRILEEMEVSRVLFEIYEGGVFLHQGQTFVVKKVCHTSKTASLCKADVNWITMPRLKLRRDVNAMETHRIREIRGSPVLAYYGAVEVSVHILDAVEIDNDPWQQDTMGMWLDIPRPTLELLLMKGIKPAAAIHSAEHAFLNRFALAQDVRTECKAEEKEKMKKEETQRKRPARLIFCDFVGQGGSVTAKAFDHVHDLLSKAHEAVSTCDCKSSEGCRRCVQSPSCKEGNKICSKMGALVLLKTCLGLTINPDEIPEEIEEYEGPETIVRASTVRALGDVQVEKDE
ncbi:P-loop containing nucleoside triphosphate hydrolase protein [Hymenopellis radicata]|nr:P-loop containing nucleoside triphosphate hydrolase protein [Hymenopellis radicata]